MNVIKKLSTGMAALALAAGVLPLQGGVVASFPMAVEGPSVTETVRGGRYAVMGNLAVMSVGSPTDGKAWRTDGYLSHCPAHVGNVVDGQRMSATVQFAIDTHAIILADNNDANKPENMVGFADCLNHDAKSGFGFFLGRTGKYAFKVYVGGSLYTLYGTGLLPLWEWTSLTGAVDGTSVKLYLNGTEVASATAASAGVKVTEGELMLGRDRYSNATAWGARTADFNGAIDLLEIRDDAAVPQYTAKYADLAVPVSRYAGDRLRALYHGQPGMNWTNETHGLLYNEADGKYHVFFQRTGSAPIMSHAHWGHITSENLYEWKDDTPALHASEDYDLRGCWSGCLFRDEAFNGGNPAIIYTGVGYGAGESYVATAYCDDPAHLRKWHKFRAPGTPRYTNTERDTYFFRNGDNCYFIVGAEGKILQYKWDGDKWVDNGVFYQFQSGESGSTEMPNVTKLANGKWLVTITPYNNGVQTVYRIGDMDAQGHFVNFGDSQLFDLFARNGYGLMSPTISTDKNGNLVALGIVADKMPTEFNLSHGYAHLYSLPRSLYTDSEGRLCQKPFEGYTAMFEGESKTVASQTLEGTLNMNPVRGRMAEVCATFEVGDATFGINFYKDSKGRGACVSYNPATHEVKIDFSQIQQLNNNDNYRSFSNTLPVYPAKGGEMKLQLFIDHSIVDLFVNDRYAASVRMFPTDDDADLIELFSNGQSVLKSATAHMVKGGDCSAKPVEPWVFHLPENSGKIAFVKSANPSEQEQAALDFFKTSFPAGAVLGTEQAAGASASTYDCLWIHIDRKGLAQGYRNLPDEYTAESLTAGLKSYVAAGGNLYLSGQATQMSVALGRIADKYAPNVYNSGNGAQGSDEWTVNPLTSHTLFANMEESDVYNHTTYGMLWGGGSSITREDHNCMWNMGEISYTATEGDNMARFEADTRSRVLGTWGQETGRGFAGIVEFYPRLVNAAEYGGTILANGMAACQWSVQDGANAYARNLQLLTANALAYLASKDGTKPYNPGGDVWTEPVQPEKPEVLESTGRVALYIGYESVDALLASDNREEKAAYNFFIKEGYEAANVICPGHEAEITVDKYDCVWVHVDRQGGTPGGRISLPTEYKSDALVNALKQFLAEGGNIYLSKQATELVNTIGRTDHYPNECSDGAGGAGHDKWHANINHNGRDYTDHTMFQGLPVEENYGMQMIVINDGSDGGVHRTDRNCMWRVNDFGGHDGFCTANNARILATWGHNAGDAMNFAGLIEFLPAKQADAPLRATAKDTVAARKGTVVVNGFGGYELAPQSGTNKAQDNIDGLTSNILKYLSPVEDITTSLLGIDAERGRVYVSGGMLYWSGLTPGTAVSLFTPSGMVLAQYSLSGDGCLPLGVTGMVMVSVRHAQWSTTNKYIVR